MPRDVSTASTNLEFISMQREYSQLKKHVTLARVGFDFERLRFGAAVIGG